MRFETIGDFVDLQRGNTYKSSLLGQAGPYLLGLGSIARDGGFRGEKLKTYGGHSDERMLVTPGDLYVSLKDVTQSGDLLGAIARVPPEIKNGRMTQDTVKLIFKKEISKDYFYWLLRTPQYREYCRSRATGTTNLGLSREDFFNFPVPCLDSKKELLVTVLEACESKITLNTQINQTLEQMAQALFKSWFVDFDPVIDNALEAGNPIPKPLAERAARRKAMWAEEIKKAPARLPAETRRLFPERFEGDEVLGWVPKGWKTKPLSQQITLIGGGTPKRSEKSFWDGDIPWFSVKDAPSESDVFVIDTEDKITQAGLKGSSAKLLPVGTTIITARGTVGKLAITGGEMAMNQSCYGVRPIKGLGNYYNFYNVKNAVVGLQQNVHGAVFDTITRQTFETVSSPLPNEDVVAEFESRVAVLMGKIKAALEENISLTKLRDTLLPKLLSGELQLPEAETAVQTALEVEPA